MILEQEQIGVELTDPRKQTDLILDGIGSARTLSIHLCCGNKKDERDWTLRETDGNTIRGDEGSYTFVW